MNDHIAARIRQNPHFIELVRKRSRLGWLLSAIMLGVYLSFILVIAFAPQALAMPLGAGTVMTVGIPVGVGVILSAFVLTGIYVRRANTEFDRLTLALREEI